MSRQAYAEVATYVDPESGDLKPADQVEVFVYKAGTTELISIYESRSGGTLISNPFIAGSNGLVEFWAVTGDYDIKFHDTKAPTRFGDYTIGWQSSPVDVEIEAGELSDEGDIEWERDPKTGAWIPQLKNNAVEEAKLAAGAVTGDKLAEAVRAQAGINSTSQKRSGKSIIATEQSRESSSYGLLGTADKVAGLVVPGDGIVFICYQALWKCSVAEAGRAAIFIGSEELQTPSAPNGSALAALAQAIGPKKPNTFGYLNTSPQGLRSPSGERPAASYGSAPETLGVYAEANLETGLGWVAIGNLAAGTYDISVRFKATSGSVTAKERKLWAWTKAFA